MLSFKEVYTYNDQPVTCPYCGNRTEIILDFSFLTEGTQIHRCLSKDCFTEFVTQEDLDEKGTTFME